MGKRKRGSIVAEPLVNGHGAPNKQNTSPSDHLGGDASKKNASALRNNGESESFAVQIVIGTYEKILHGLVATITSKNAHYHDAIVEFQDTFLLHAHGSAIRCLAVSPRTNDTDRVYLASGSSDQTVNLYSLSTTQPSRSTMLEPPMPVLAGQKVTENPRNRELGSLQHHSGGINAMCFPTRSKLLTAADDSTMAVARTRDWTILSTIKAPIPKAHGRPSGDTTPLGSGPAGVNDFAVHPSMKLMISVSKGEKCMRLWNLVTGKRAAVLNFDRDHLQSVGEGKHSSGEGRKVRWNRLGEEYVIAFDHGCLVYGIDSNPRCCVLPLPRTKIHQIQYFNFPSGKDVQELLVLSTDDARILFYRTELLQSTPSTTSHTASSIPACEPIAQLGGIEHGFSCRIKDFETLSIPNQDTALIVTASSDGAVRLWLVDSNDFSVPTTQPDNKSATNGLEPMAADLTASMKQLKHVGELLDIYEAGNRITCLKAFAMSTLND